MYRKPVVRKDPTTGEKTKAKSTKWWGQYKDAHGRLRRHPLSVDKRAAQAMLNEVVRKVELEKAGLVDRTDDERKRPLKVLQHLTRLRLADSPRPPNLKAARTIGEPTLRSIR